MSFSLVAGFWHDKRVLVTGATGMVGSWLVKDLLVYGAHVVALVRDADPQTELYRSGDIYRVEVVSGDLEDFRAVDRAINEHEIDTVFHLGAQTIVGTAYRRPLSTFEANIRGTYNLLEACRVHAQLVHRIVVASSDKAYGEQPQLPYVEEMPLQGRHPYEVSKSCSDLIAQTYHHTYGLPVAIARCGNVYGGGDLNWSRIVPGTIRSLLLGDRPIIRSNGAYVRDYLYVKDTVHGYLRIGECLSNPQVHGQGFNFSTETPLTVLEVVAQIQEITNRTALPPVIQNCANGEIPSQHLSAAKARRILGWVPEFDLATGLRETIAWYRRFLGEERSGFDHDRGRAHSSAASNP